MAKRCRSRLVAGSALAPAAFLLSLPAFAQTTSYTADWASLDKHNPTPAWFQDAKFGIYYHWGAFGVAEYGSEWYPRNMYNKGDGAYNHHVSTYGDPFGNWPFDKFLTGANDKAGKPTIFAPKQVSDGGSWDPDAWAQLFADAGARFAGPVAEHHDGFSMWDSKVNPWNSVAYGPKLNLAKIQADAMRRHGLRVLMSQHTAYNFTGYYEFAPAQTDAAMKQLYGQLPKDQEETIWLGKLKELIDEFLPDVIWQDFNLNKISDANLTTFLAYYYNAAAKAGVEVVATAKDGIATAPPGSHKGQVYDYERGGPGDITTPYWLTDDAVSSSSWCYTQGMGYYSVASEVHTFIDHVAKGGNLLLNISPLPDGTIPQAQKDILSGFGAFLKVAGEAIYNTRAWAVYGEGPTKIGGGSFTGPKAMTANDIRYTRSNESATGYDAVYALLGGWTSGGQVNMTAVTTSRFPLGSGKVFLFAPLGGQPTELAATQDGSGLHVTLPGSAPYTALAYAIKISKSGTPPAPPAWIGGADGGVPSSGGNSGTLDAGSAGAGGAGTGAGGQSAAGGTAGGAGSGGTRGTGGASGGGSGGVVGSGGAMSTGGRGSGGTSSASAGSSGGASGGAPSTGGTAGSPGHGGSSGGNGGTSASQGGSSSGCSCTLQGSRRAGASLLLLGLALSSALRRWRRQSGQ